MVQPFYKCNKFMLNSEQVAFNIIEERMQNPRTWRERDKVREREREREGERDRERENEHLCHCYACCLVTTFFTVQRAEVMHEESRPL